MHNKKFTVVIEYENCSKEESEKATGHEDAIGFNVNNVCCYKEKEVPFETVVMLLGTVKGATHDLLVEAMMRKLASDNKIKVSDIPQALLAREVFDTVYEKTIGKTEAFFIDRESVDGSER